MNDWLSHRLRRGCLQPVTGHEYEPAAHPDWGGFTGCIWLPHPKADRCMRPRRCHVPPPAEPG